MTKKTADCHEGAVDLGASTVRCNQWELVRAGGGAGSVFRPVSMLPVREWSPNKG